MCPGARKVVLFTLPALLGVSQWACSKGSAPDGIEVVVNVDPAAQAACLTVVAQAPGGPEKSTAPVARGGQNRFVVAVFRSADLSGQITVQARGFLDLGCTVLIEHSAPGTAAFQDGTVPVVTLQLSPATCESGCTTPPGSCFQASGACGADGGCAYAPLSTGTACADDGNPCTDDACDGLGNCTHPPKGMGTPCGSGNPCASDVCDSAGHCLMSFKDAGTACGGGTSCTLGGTCDARGQCNGTPILCQTPPGQCFSDAGFCVDGGCAYPVRVAGACATGDPCLLGGQCTSDGGCSGTPLSCTSSPGQCFSDAGFCFDGGCSYPVLFLTTCDTGDPCVLSGLCAADGGCRGVPMACGTSPGQCFSDAGTCFDGGCAYPVLVAGPCLTGDACITGGACLADGGCAGTPVSCTTAPGPCYSDAGSCVSGSCMYPPLTGTSCSSDLCQSGQVCDAGVCGGGSPLTCAPIDCEAGLCSPLDGGCSYTPVIAGVLCDGGTCGSGGVCHGDFGYPPSNFVPGAIVNVAPAVTLNCAVTFDSTPDASNGPWCASPLPPQTLVVQDGGSLAVVVAMTQLTVLPGGTLQLVGSLPVILAVFGDAGVYGAINASSQGADGGADGPGNGCAGADGQNAGTSGGGGGGGGFAKAGGNGGNGMGSTGGAGSAPLAGAAPLIPLRGGCSGGQGGATAGASGPGGAGGGALQLSAAGILDVDAGFWAEGGGGQGAGAGKSGGGGGGSGGAILLEGQGISFGPGTRVTANGGGGGQGGAGGPGAAGQDGLFTSGAQAAGGSGGTGGAGGGKGGADGGNAANGMPGNGGMGAGGGGGGFGFIRINTPTSCQFDPSAVVFSGHTSTNAAASCP